MKLSLTPIKIQIGSALSMLRKVKELNDQDPASRTIDLEHIKFDPSSLKPHLVYLSNCTSGEDLKLLQELTQVACIGEVVVPYESVQELIDLFSELHKLTEVHQEGELEVEKRKIRIDNLRNHIATLTGVNGIKDISQENLDDASSQVIKGNAIMIDLSSHANNLNWYSTVQHSVFYRLTTELTNRFFMPGGQWPVFEALKNAFLHGNDLDCNLPIFLKLNVDDGNNVQSFEVYDMAEGKDDDVTRELKRMIARLGQVGGYGMGLNKIQSEWGWNIQPETLKDNSTRKIIGKKYVYARNCCKL